MDQTRWLNVVMDQLEQKEPGQEEQRSARVSNEQISTSHPAQEEKYNQVLEQRQALKDHYYNASTDYGAANEPSSYGQQSRVSSRDFQSRASELAPANSASDRARLSARFGDIPRPPRPPRTRTHTMILRSVPPLPPGLVSLASTSAYSHQKLSNSPYYTPSEARSLGYDDLPVQPGAMLPGSQASLIREIRDAATPTSQSNHRGTNLFTCQDCGRRYSRLEHLARHMQTHTLGRRFACAICQKSFARKEQLWRHVANHDNDTPKKRQRTTTSSGAGRLLHPCGPCYIAREKCDDTKPCKRCVSRNLNCVSTEAPSNFSLKHFRRNHWLTNAHSGSPKPNNSDPNNDGDKSFADKDSPWPHAMARESNSGSILPEDSGYGSIAHSIVQVHEATRQASEAQLQPMLDEGADSDQTANMSENDDLLTCYSGAAAISIERIEHHALEFAEELFKTISGYNLDKSRLENSFPLILNLLRDFSIIIGLEGAPQVYRDVMYFTHKYRGHICKWLRHISSKSGQSESRSESLTSERIPLQDRITLWFKGLPGTTTEYLNFDELRYVEDVDISDIPSISEQDWYDEKKVAGKDAYTGVFRDFVLKSSACRWLLSRLRLELCSAPDQSNAMNAIKSAIASRLKGSGRISKKRAMPCQTAVFIIDWDLKGFLHEQELTIAPHEAIAKIITLTGVNDAIQALPAKEYMEQTWPMTGLQVMRLVQGAYESAGLEFRDTLCDGTELTALFREGPFEEPEFVVRAEGSSPFLSEVGEQLAWVTSALRSSPSRGWKQCVYCTPFISSAEVSLNQVVCKIEFEFKTLEKRRHPINGQCWQNLFTSPVIVSGYPIPCRLEADKGIEIPLNMMAFLAGTRQIDTFKGKTFIKGFSTLIYPTKKTDEIIHWHLVDTENESRISYLNDAPGHAGYIEKRELERCRCVLGWCSNAEFYAGSAQADYLIKSASLDTPNSGCPLADLSLVPGVPVADCSSFTICKKDCDVSTKLGRKGYIKKLKWLDKKFALLWDEEDQRGWLVKGLAALLHLVRSSLEYDSVDKFSTEFLFKKHDLEEAASFEPQAAVKILLSKTNKALKLYKEEDENFQDRVDHCFCILEKLIDYQEDAGEKGDRDLKEHARKNLSGWDFHDLVTKSDTRLFSRMTTLETPGKSWVDFIRSIQAVTLFGRGFGTLIKPSGSDEVCNNWNELPKHRFYISAAISDLKDMINNSYTKTSHTRIGPSTIWHTTTTTFEYTSCSLFMGGDCHEPVQSLLPLSMSNVVCPRRQGAVLPDWGAVIFGHHSKLKWVWEDFGPPRPGEFSPLVSKLVDSPLPTDSGYISSQKSFTQRLESKSSLSESSIAKSTPFPESLAAVEQYHREAYTVGILCALSTELLAVRSLLEETHNDIDRVFGDDYVYALGRMGQHNVVATCLPDGEYGTNPAADCATNMRRSFPNIKLCLLVGVGGGVPSETNDIRLGDVVVSLPKGDLSGVIQYDRGKENDDVNFERTGALQGPPRALRILINYLKSTPGQSSDPLVDYIEMIRKSESARNESRFSYPGQDLDVLFETCDSEDDTDLQRSAQIKHRDPRLRNNPVVHYGIIASGNRVIKNARFRDEWGRKYGVLCFEMEAAGVMNILPTLVIRGICDYCDATKNKVWQEYAAATAAAYARYLLDNLPRHNPDDKVPLSRTNSSSWDIGVEEPPRKRIKTS